MSGDDDVIELSICEVPHVVLRVGPTYRFYALEGCETCEGSVTNYPGQVLTPRAPNCARVEETP